MSRVREELPPTTAAEALGGLMVDQLRALALAATGSRQQGRKAELVARIAASLDAVGVRRIYHSLDEIDRAAVSEAAHAALARLDAARFHAKCGRDPGWGARPPSGTCSRCCG